MEPFRPNRAQVLVTLCMFLAAAAAIALFMVPVRSTWFWPTAAAFAAFAAAALLVRLPPRNF